MQRIVQPEILDRLPPNDPDAVRSRRDLRRINAMMGNHRWLVGRVSAARNEGHGVGPVIEVGAGDGALAGKLAYAGVMVTGLDLAPPPPEPVPGVTWRQGDLFETFSLAVGDTLVACLILHHFEDGALARLGGLIRGGDLGRVLAVEPHRSVVAEAQGRLLFPFVNAVTRHDMVVSIRAGFRRGELARALGLDVNEWTVRESITPLGAYRFEASRKG